MSTNASPLVQIYAPDGTLGDVPYDQMHAAVQAGGKIAVHIQAPDGTLGFVPADRAGEALKAGGKRVPLDMESRPTKEGFLEAAGSTIKGMLQMPSGQNPYPGMGQEEKAAAAGQAYQQDIARQQAGYSPAYRAAAPLAQAVGADVPGMERAAAAGDPEGVMGHAAGSLAPVAATELARHGGAIIPGRQAIAEKIAGPVVRQTPTATASNLKFGRNPAEAITREPGLSGLTVDSLNHGVGQRMHELGRVMDETLALPENAAKTISTEPIIDKAVAEAKSSPIAKLNPGLADRIDSLAENLKTQFGDLDKNPLEAAKFKRDIGEATKWTGQAFDNEANQFLVDVYRGIKDKVNEAVPETKGYNERYADLLSAKKALERRIAFDTNRALSPGRAMLGAGGGALGVLTGGAIGGVGGAALGLGVDALRSTPSRLALGKLLGNKYPELSSPVSSLAAVPAAAPAAAAPSPVPPPWGMPAGQPARLSELARPVQTLPETPPPPAPVAKPVEAAPAPAPPPPAPKVESVERTAAASSTQSVPVRHEFQPEQIEEAKLLIRSALDTMASADKPGRYFAENPEQRFTPQREQSASKGVTSGGHWYGVKSLRNQLPWIKDHPEWSPSMLERALKSGDGNPTYERAIRSAVEFIEAEKETPEAKAARLAPKIKSWENFFAK